MTARPDVAGVLREGALRLGVALDERQLERFALYLALLRRWNGRIQLTSADEPLEVVERHFVDSLAVVPALAGAHSLVDVGSGGGFPGLPLAIAVAGLRVTVVESIYKKAAFLEAVKRELALDDVEVAAERMDRLVAAGRTFDAAVSRATFPPSEWVRLGAPLVAPGGRLIAMIVPDRDNTAEVLGGESTPHFETAAVLPAYGAGRALFVMTGRRARLSPDCGSD